MHQNCQLKSWLARNLFKPLLELDRNCLLDRPLLQPLQDVGQQPRQPSDDLRVSHFSTFQRLFLQLLQKLMMLETTLSGLQLFCSFFLLLVSCADTSAGVGALRLFGSPLLTPPPPPPPRKVSLLLLLLLLLLLAGAAPQRSSSTIAVRVNAQLLDAKVLHHPHRPHLHCHRHHGHLIFVILTSRVTVVPMTFSRNIHSLKKSGKRSSSFFY